MVAIKAAVFALVSAAVASAAAVERDFSLTSIVGDLLCPTLFTVNNNGTVPGKTAGDVWTFIGDFCDPSWQGFAADCNVPGSSRTFSLLGLTLTERLDLNVGSSSSPAKWETFFAQAFTLTGNPQVLATSVTNTHDLLKVETTKAGAYISWNVVGCSNNTATAEAIFGQVHGGGIETAIAHFA